MVNLPTFSSIMEAHQRFVKDGFSADVVFVHASIGPPKRGDINYPQSGVALAEELNNSGRRAIVYTEAGPKARKEIEGTLGPRSTMSCGGLAIITELLEINEAGLRR